MPSRLIQNGGNAVIEHNMDVIRAGDWIIDLGPAGPGGYVGHEARSGWRNRARRTQEVFAYSVTPTLTARPAHVLIPFSLINHTSSLAPRCALDRRPTDPKLN